MSWIITGEQKNNWTPADIDTALWLDAADASTVTIVDGAVSQWSDKSGNNNHYTQSTIANRPTYEAAVQNGLNAIRIINGPNSGSTRQWLESAVTYSGTQISLFTVHLNVVGSSANVFGRLFSFASASQQDFNNTNGLALLYGIGGGVTLYRNSSVIATSAAINNEWCFVCADRNGTSGRVSLNGNTFVTGSTSSASQGITRARIGNDFSTTDSGMFGYLAEKVVVFGTLSDADWQRLQGYAAHKWGLTANLPADHPYKTAIPVP